MGDIAIGRAYALPFTKHLWELSAERSSGDDNWNIESNLASGCTAQARAPNLAGLHRASKGAVYTLQCCNKIFCLLILLINKQLTCYQSKLSLQTFCYTQPVWYRFVSAGGYLNKGSKWEDSDMKLDPFKVRGSK